MVERYQTAYLIVKKEGEASNGEVTSMDKKSRKKPQRRAERKGKSFLQQGENQDGQEEKFETTSSKAKNQEGCGKEEKFLCQNEGHEEEEHIKEDSKQPEEQDQQEPKSLELLSHIHILLIPELEVSAYIMTNNEHLDWDEFLGGIKT